jgi:uncharacterized protein
MALPIVRLTDIPDEGLTLESEVLPEEMALSVADAQVKDSLSVAAELYKAGKIVAVRGSVAGTFVRQCVRCLKEYEVFVRVPFSVEYHQSGKGIGVEAGHEQDIYDYDGEQVDLAAMLREHVILATPMQPLCVDDCLGLCPVCGQDRNERLCGCPEQVQPSPFSALQQLRDTLPDPRRPMRPKSDPQRN